MKELKLLDELEEYMHWFIYERKSELEKIRMYEEYGVMLVEECMRILEED